jgi:alanyl-tRNA synthetase
MKAKEIRQKFLNFFQQKQHTTLPSSSIVPENDSSTLFITAGMQPFVPYLLGKNHPQGKRLTNSQKCIRTIDIEEVGDDTHLSFFEMLGNWSLGDYFKKESIEYSYEFLTKELNIDPKKLAVSVWEGDENIPRDTESFEIWKSLGIPTEKIAFFGKDNFWQLGETGPCGTDTEIFYYTGENIPENFQDTHTDPKWVEIWNNVFMEYMKNKDGSITELPQKNVDTGMGLARIAAVLQNKNTIWDTDIFEEQKEIIRNHSSHYEKHSARIIIDHCTTALIAINDGVLPSNIESGYVIRKLLRRAIFHMQKIELTQEGFTKLLQNIGEYYQDIATKITESQIQNEIHKEQEKFLKTLETGKHLLEKKIQKLQKENETKLSGTDAFFLYETHGFPLELTEEYLKKYNISVDTVAFEQAYQAHQQTSKTASKAKFKGGLADQSPETVRLHTAAHLMLAGLRKILGDHVHQKGSNITNERLRFDFSHSEKMTDEQKQDVEKYVNTAIQSSTDITCETLPLDIAKQKGAEGEFMNTYGEEVDVYHMGEFSYEICGGPHAKNTSELNGTFKIKKEQSSSSGVRRIKAVIE